MWSQTTTELATPTRTVTLSLTDRSGYLDASALYDASDAAGFTATKLRLALRRLVESGLLQVEGRGRRAQIQLSAEGLAERSPDLAWTGAAYRADAGLDPWDGVWHIASFEIPEDQRAARDALRGQIIDLFGGQLSGGLYLSPFGWEPWLESIAHMHGVADRLTTLEASSVRHGGTSDQAAVASLVWPVSEVHDSYVQFIDRWEPLVSAVPDNPGIAIRAAFEAAAEFEAAFRQDPLLPAEVVPAQFAGPSARSLFRQVVDALACHDVLATADLFGAYSDAIDDALTANQDDFWLGVYAATSNPVDPGDVQLRL
ncbi:MAG: PaaX family transcriptional regulator C-terminal domain-containing protein [Acidimicrobiales bacterium]